MDFLIIASGLNCNEHVDKCIESLEAQTYTNWRAVLISDGSTDGTARKLLRCTNKKIQIAWFNDNQGAAKRRFDAISKSGANDETIILLLGLDDHLLPNALQHIRWHYQRGAWMSYGNWINQNGVGLPEDFNLKFDEDTHRNRDYRKVLYRSTAPNTFKKFLFDAIPEHDFRMNNGRYFDTTTESHLMFCCLEMSGKSRIAVIKRPIYVYNEMLRNGTNRRLGSRYKRRVLAEVVARPKKPKLIR